MRPTILILLYFFCSNAYGQFRPEERILISGRDTLKGTLIIAGSAKKKHPVILLQPRSGPTDRNGNNPLGVSANSYRLLAEALAKKNISTLLIDKRGIAKSASAGKSEKDLRFAMYADDLAAWANLIRKEKKFSRIIIAGHSEGSLLAMLAAQAVKPDAYISLEGAGRSIDKILVSQVSKQLPAATKAVDSLLTRLKAGQKLDSVPPYLFSILRPSVQPYMASWMKYDPCEELKKLTCPVLIMQGTTDIQTEEIEGQTLKSCVPKAEYVLMKGMNHILKDAPADMQKNIKTYSDPTLPLSAGLVESIEHFVKKIR